MCDENYYKIIKDACRYWESLSKKLIKINFVYFINLDNVFCREKMKYVQLAEGKTWKIHWNQPYITSLGVILHSTQHLNWFSFFLYLHYFNWENDIFIHSQGINFSENRENFSVFFFLFFFWFLSFLKQNFKYPVLWDDYPKLHLLSHFSFDLLNTNLDHHPNSP